MEAQQRLPSLFKVDTHVHVFMDLAGNMPRAFWKFSLFSHVIIQFYNITNYPKLTSERD